MVTLVGQSAVLWVDCLCAFTPTLSFFVLIFSREQIQSRWRSWMSWQCGSISVPMQSRSAIGAIGLSMVGGGCAPTLAQWASSCLEARLSLGRIMLTDASMGRHRSREECSTGWSGTCLQRAQIWNRLRESRNTFCPPVRQSTTAEYRSLQ